MNKHVAIKLETAFGNGAGCRLEPAEVAQIVEERRRIAGGRQRREGKEAEANPLSVRGTDPLDTARGESAVLRLR